jgi:hypothetical protein
LLVLLALIAAPLALWWRGPEWSDVYHAFDFVTWWWIVAALALNLLSVLARAISWRLSIGQALPDPQPPFGRVFSAFGIGLLGNAVLPARAGELARVAVLRRHVDAEQGPSATLLGTVFAHRLFDLFPVALLVAFVLVTAKIPHWALTSVVIVLLVGVALLALVDTQPDMAAVQHFHETDIGALRETRVIFDRGSQAGDRRVGDRGHAYHGMRIADRDGADLDLARPDGERVDISLTARLEWQRSRVEVRYAHRHRNLAILHPGLHQTARAVEHEIIASRTLAFAQEPGNAACAVAALFDFAAVGVEDPVEHDGSRAARRLEHQRLVEADAGIAVGKAAKGLGVGRSGSGSVEDDEIVAEAIHLREAHRPMIARKTAI